MAELKKHLLLVEDEAPLREALAERLAEHGFDVQQAESGEQAIEQLADFAFDIVVTDLRLPGLDGTRVLEAALLRYPDIVGIIVTGYGTVKDAVEAIQRGAADFVTKPFQFDELLHALNSALEKRKLKAENAYLRSQLQERYKFEGLIGRSPAMRTLFQLLETVSPSPSTILVTGETGTGKEVVARAIHHNSPRRAQRFVALNCGAIPETLLEAELFGHVRGAFTGAIGTRQGRLEQAHKGTLFMDEVGTMSAGMQMKLLRVLQEREFERVGDTHTTKVDVRVVAATNSDLQKMVADGSFREDLFYILQAEYHSDSSSAAEGAQRGHPTPRSAFSQEIRGDRIKRRWFEAATRAWPRHRTTYAVRLAAGDAVPHGVPLAWKCSSARKRDRARCCVERRPHAD
jgi:DNA-binding NtrC family response regulator